MTVLFSELLVPGWAEGDDAMIGLNAVTGVYGTDRAFTLPCHNSNPEIFFSEKRSLQPTGFHPPRGIAPSGFRPLRKIPHCCLP